MAAARGFSVALVVGDYGQGACFYRTWFSVLVPFLLAPLQRLFWSFRSPRPVASLQE